MGIEATIERFVDIEYPKVVAAVRLITGDRESAEDAVQDALVKAWQRPDAEQIESLAAALGVDGARWCCRPRGPDGEVVGRLLRGDRVVVVSRSEDGAWFCS